MPKALIIVSDSDLKGISHKMVVPSLKLFYKKLEWDVEVLDLIESQFTSLGNSGILFKKYINAYKNSIKTARDIHFITETNLGALSPELEKFFKDVLVEGFAYNNKGLLDGRAFFHLHHKKVTLIPFNLPWFRIRFSKLNSIFKKSKIFQTKSEKMSTKDRLKYMNSIKTKIRNGK